MEAMLINSSANPTGDITMPTVQGALEHLHDLSVSSHTGNFEDIRISQDAALLAVVVLSFIGVWCNQKIRTLGTFAGDSSPFTWSS